jgi:photosystem II stability/assembly factor-like uncharacterized protein
MLRSLSIAAGLAGAAAALTVACSGTFDPTTAQSRSPDPTSTPSQPTLTPQQSGTSNRLQAVSPVNSRIVWASGLGGTFVVTTDGGETWRAGVVAGAEALQFRDVEGVNARTAYLLAAGSGTDSRIYKTENGGRSWTLQFKNRDRSAFYDCFAFWSSRRGLTFSDAVNGRFPAILTTNGRTWRDIGDRMPPAQPGEAAFAASGTCVATQGENRAWIATGAAEKARILATTDGGDTWNAYDTPIVQGTPASGGFSVAFRDRSHGILVGGDLENEGTTDNVAVSGDGGKTWRLATPTPFPGAAFGVSYVPGSRQRTVLATGPGGAAWSSDEGRTWTRLEGVEGFWSVAFATRRAGWLVGTDGRILKVSFGRSGGDSDSSAD